MMHEWDIHNIEEAREAARRISIISKDWNIEDQVHMDLLEILADENSTQEDIIALNNWTRRTKGE